MAQKTRGSLFINFIILASVLAIGYVVVVIFGQQPDGKGNGDNHCTYLMTVTFKPTPQDPQVSVGYSINGGATKWSKESNSPWVRSVPARCGSVVVLSANVDPKFAITKGGPNLLNCRIQHGDKSYSDEARPGELSAHCAAG